MGLFGIKTPKFVRDLGSLGGTLRQSNPFTVGSIANPISGPFGLTGSPLASALLGQKWGGMGGQDVQAFSGGARPTSPAFEGARDSSGALLPQYQLKEQLDPRAMEAARAEGLQPAGSRSVWGNIARQQQGDALTRQQASQYGQAQNRLAMSGGLRTGAAERLASQSMRGGLAARQDVGSNISMQEDQNRQKWLQQLPGMEINQAQQLQGTDRFNIGNTLGDITQKRAFDQANYAEQMRAWGAERTAAATPKGGKK